jgi:glycosyltransferase involved in cell wall biosynthesis
VAVIPCLNEEAAIAEVVRGVKHHLPNVIVVDDGSTDQTGELAAKAGAEVIRQTVTRGKGAALRAGWERVRQRGFSWALTLDGDGQHAPEDIPAILAAGAAGDVDLVVGNRMAEPGQMPWIRKRTNGWMSRRLSEAAGLWLPDSQCGFRLMRIEAWATLPIETSHFEIESEVLLGFVARRFAVTFVPVRAIYKSEQSKIHPVRDSVRWFRWWFRARRAVVRARR